MKDKHQYSGLQMSSLMSTASAYVLGRIAESETSVETKSAVAKNLDNAVTSDTEYMAVEEEEKDNNEETNQADFELLVNDSQERTNTEPVNTEYYFVQQDTHKSIASEKAQFDIA